jgi:hypothetical protein
VLRIDAQGVVAAVSGHLIQACDRLRVDAQDEAGCGCQAPMQTTVKLGEAVPLGRQVLCQHMGQGERFGVGCAKDVVVCQRLVC